MDAIYAFDGQILLWLQENLRNDVLTPILTFITHLADSGWLWIAISLLLLCFKKTRPLGCMSALALVGSVLFNNIILKPLIARPRPYAIVDGKQMIEGLRLIIKPETDFSFPSGHSGASLAASVVLLCKAPKKYGVPAFILALLICFSRLYVGVHYPTDVFAGIATGTLAAVIAMAIYPPICKKLGPERCGKLGLAEADSRDGDSQR